MWFCWLSSDQVVPPPEAEARIAHHVDPGRGSDLSRSHGDHIFRSVAGKTADAVREFQPRRHGGCPRFRTPRPRQQDGRRTARRIAYRHRGRLGVGRAQQLLGQASAARHQHGARHRQQQVALFDRQHVGAQHEHRSRRGSRRRLPGRCRHRPVHPHHGLERVLKILRVGNRLFVQDHQIDRELLAPPIFVREQQMAHDLEIAFGIDAQQHDRQIARDPARP